jgi:hypothetical protein
VAGWGIVDVVRVRNLPTSHPRTNRKPMSQLSSKKRARLPKSAFAYVDSRGRRRLPIHDESHVRNALERFNQVAFEDEAARERARKRLLDAAKKYGIVPIGLVTGQLRSQMQPVPEPSMALGELFLVDVEHDGSGPTSATDRGIDPLLQLGHEPLPLLQS